MTLKNLEIGEKAVVDAIGGGGEDALRQHFLDMGVIPGAEITLEKYAPMSDPMELRIHGYELTLRIADAEKIQVHKVKSNSTEEPAKRHNHGEKRPAEHPGLGEGGRYHVKAL